MACAELGEESVSDDTLPRLPSNTTDEGGTAGDVLTLVIAWSEEEPNRVGESCSFPDLGREFVLGRGYGEGTELRVGFGPWRPGDRPSAEPLAAEHVSRRQLEVVPVAVGISLKLLGPGELYIDGERADEGLALVGQTIRLDKRLLLLVTRRPTGFTPRFLLPAARGCRFGEPDRFAITGESVALARMLDEVAFAAQSGEHVLVRGDTGTGKELVARAVHAHSERAKRPFVEQNAAAIPTELIDAELCGHAADFPNKGMAETRGIIGETDDGTLFFDEIGEMSQDLQAHLLRILDAGGQYRRVGDPKKRRTDLRMVGATNRPLDGMKHDLLPRFRRHIEVPPLSARPEDIALIARAYARKLVSQKSPLMERFVEDQPDGARDVRIGIDFVEALLSCDHPTNVRGLEKAVLDSMMKSPGRTLRAYPELIARSRRGHAGKDAAPIRTPGGHVRVTPELEARVRLLLDGSHGSVTRAAQALGLSRDQVKRLRDRLGIGRTPSEEDDTPDP
jgi:two-component system nitrogen regulation response regulator GlnG/two-component system response regulator HydG